MSGSSSYDESVVKSEDFRAGFPDLPKLPMEIKAPSVDKERIDIWHRCISKTAAIFEQAGLDYNEIHINMIKGKGDAIFHSTIIARVPNSDDKALWQPTLIDVEKILNEENSSDLHVLILEPRGDKLDHAYIIRHDHPIVRLWPEKIVRPVLEVLESVDFIELCVWNWGITEEAAELTVVIVVEDQQKYLWDKLVEQILEICADHGAAYLKVAIKEGSQYEATSYMDPTSHLDQGRIEGRRSYCKRVAMGHSISAEPTGGGTLGGYLVLVDPKNSSDRTTIFITSWHVLRPSDPELSAEYDDGLQIYGGSMLHESAVVQSPAMADLRSRISELKISLSMQRDSHRLLFLQNESDNGTATTREQQLLAEKLDDVQTTEQQVRDYESIITTRSKLCFGQAKMASGYRKSEHIATDWAIGEPDLDRIGGNLLPNQSDLDRLTRFKTYHLFGAEHVPEINKGPLQDGQEVFRVGRTTGLTVGKIHPVDATCKIIRPPNSRHEKHQKTTVEHKVVIARFPDVSNAPGDSGAWILDEGGSLVGLLWGGNVGTFAC